MSTEEKAKVMNEDAIKEIEELEESASHSGDDFQYEPVPEGKRQNWYDLVFVWFGAAMVAQLYQAGVTVTIGTGGLPNGLKAILGGALFLALFTALSGYVGYKTHCNAALSSRFAYGSVGVAIPGFHIADIGWYVVNAAMFCSSCAFSAVFSAMAAAKSVVTFAALGLFLLPLGLGMGYTSML